MARDILRFNLQLDRLYCRGVADGWGNAEPYVWTVMFKVDGGTVMVTDVLLLSGNATIETSVGSHGNLVLPHVKAGDTVIVPASVGSYDGCLYPIRVPPQFSSVAKDIPGIVGLVVIVMEEDNVSAVGAEAGHQAMNSAVIAAVNQMIATRTFSNQAISAAELAQFSSSIADAVAHSIQGQQNVLQNFWSLVNPDDMIGQSVFLFNHDELATGGTINFSDRYRNEGDWEIFGRITSTVSCAANALENVFSGSSGVRAQSTRSSFADRTVIDPKSLSKHSIDKRSLKAVMKQVRDPESKIFDLNTLRKFREGPFKKYPGLSNWWELLQRNTPAIVHALLTEPSLRKPVYELMTYLSEFAANPKKPIPKSMLDLAEKAALEMASLTNSRRLARDCGWVLGAISHLRKKEGAEILKFLSEVVPAKHPEGLPEKLKTK